MKIELNKTLLAGALTALGKLVCRTSPVNAYKSIQIEAKENILHFRTCSENQVIAYRMEAETEGDFSITIGFESFRQVIRGRRNKSIILDVSDSGLLLIDGVMMPALDCVFPEVSQVPTEGIKTIQLPDTFVSLLNTVAPVVSRNDYRKQLQGINLSKDGITGTNGKELLNIPVSMDIESLTIPFPLALIATKASGTTRLNCWTDGSSVYFRITAADWSWSGKAVTGTYPNWKLIIPDRKELTHSVSFTGEQAEQLKNWLKMVPDDPPNNGIELSLCNQESIKVRSLHGSETIIPAEVSCEWGENRLIVNRDILLRLFSEGHTRIGCSKDHGPFIATGGIGQYVAMPLSAATSTVNSAGAVSNDTSALANVPEENTQNSIHSETLKQAQPQNQHKESYPMVTLNNEVSVPVQTVAINKEPVTEQVNPLDDLSASIEAFKLKLRVATEEANALSRKVKEVSLMQKQKERDFIVARRAIERIRMAI